MGGLFFAFSFVLWLGGIVACVAIASNTQRSVPAWALIGVLLGPLGAIIALIVCYAAPVPVPAPLSLPGVTCPECLSVVPAKAKKCRYCASTLPPVDDLVEDLLAAQATEQPCFLCGFQLSADYAEPGQSCPNCGRKDPLGGPRHDS